MLSEECRASKRDQDEEHPERTGEFRSHFPSSDRSQALDWMQSISFEVSHIIYEVKATAQEAEGYGSENRVRSRLAIEEASTENESSEYEPIL